MTKEGGNGQEIAIAVRDLSWIISAPYMLADPPLPELSKLPETRDLILGLEQDPDPLLTHLDQLNRHTLGSYFEHLVVFWLDHLPSVKILATNLQVFDGATTIGEFDLLFTHERKIYHWELAIKFYLNTGSGRRESDFVGPKRQDNLDLKLTHLYGHQLLLAQRKEAESALNQLTEGKIHSFPWVKGVLFQLGSPDAGFRPAFPERVSCNCPRGRWVRMSELEACSLPAFEFFIFPKKPHWLASRFYTAESYHGGLAALQQLACQSLKDRDTPLLTYLLTPGDQDLLDVQERLFIVPDKWNG